MKKAERLQNLEGQEVSFSVDGQPMRGLVVQDGWPRDLPDFLAESVPYNVWRTMRYLAIQGTDGAQYYRSRRDKRLSLTGGGVPCEEPAALSAQ